MALDARRAGGGGHRFGGRGGREGEERPSIRKSRVLDLRFDRREAGLETA
jgi:hypothetical protein